MIIKNKGNHNLIEKTERRSTDLRKVQLIELCQKRRGLRTKERVKSNLEINVLKLDIDPDILEMDLGELSYVQYIF